MAGTLFGLPLSVQIDANGDPLAGCKLYVYAAGTSTPATTYEDFGLTAGLELSFPIVANSAGRLPQFWVDDGSYRARLVDSAGNEIFDLSSVTAIGASSGSVSTGSGVSDTALIQTGDFLWNPVSGTRTGFVRANARTIGSSSSGATERASSDCEDLFLFLWANFSDTLCPVSGGRGGTAAGDWAANKAIATLDMRGRAPYGMDDMGNSAASIISGATTAGAAHGQETKTVLQANLPSVNFSNSLTAADHTHTQQGTFTSGNVSADHTHTYSGTTSTESATHTHSGAVGSTPSDNIADTGSGTTTISSVGTTSTGIESALHTHTFSGTSSGISANHTHNVTISGATVGSGALAVSGTVSSGGSGTALATLSPGRAGSWFIKL